MYRLLLLNAATWCALTAHGQNLLRSRKYQVYEEEFAFFNVNAFDSQGAPAHKVSYILTANADFNGAVQVNRRSVGDPTSPTAMGSVVCRVSGLSYLEHSFEDGRFTETYKASYKAFKGGSMPPIAVIPNPGAVQVSWEENCNGNCVLRVNWFVQSNTSATQAKKSSIMDAFKSYYVYTLRCRPLN